MNIDNNDMSMHITGELDHDKMLPMEEVVMRTMTKKRNTTKKIPYNLRKTSTKIAKRKRCKTGSRRNPKTKRCNLRKKLRTSVVKP